MKFVDIAAFLMVFGNIFAAPLCTAQDSGNPPLRYEVDFRPMERAISGRVYAPGPLEASPQDEDYVLPVWGDLYGAGPSQVSGVNRNVSDGEKDALNSWQDLARVRWVGPWTWDNGQWSREWVGRLDAPGPQVPLERVQWVLAAGMPCPKKGKEGVVQWSTQAQDAWFPHWVQKVQRTRGADGRGAVDSWKGDVCEGKGVVDPLAQETNAQDDVGLLFRELDPVRFGAAAQIFWAQLKVLLPAQEGRLPRPLVFERRGPTLKPLLGLIPISVPAQGLFRWAVVDETHWPEWQLANRMVEQVFGAQIRLEGPRGRWLRQGLASFATQDLLERLEEDEKPGPWRTRLLFGKESSWFSGFSWDHLQHLSLLASLDVRRQSSDLSLCCTAPVTSQSFARLALALRHMDRHMVSHGGVGVWPALSEISVLEGLSAEELWEEALHKMEVLNSDLTGGSSAQQILQALAREKGTWDGALVSVEKMGANWVVRLEQNGVAHPRESQVFWSFDGTTWGSQWSQNGEVRIPVKEGQNKSPQVILDKERLAFDSDRFNNTNGLFDEFAIFPGPARTIPDGGVTFVWMPLVLRTSGKPWQVGFVGGVLNWVNSGTLVASSWAPSSGENAFFARRQTVAPWRGWTLALEATKGLGGEWKGGLWGESKWGALQEGLLAEGATVGLRAEIWWSGLPIDKPHFPLTLSVESPDVKGKGWEWGGEGKVVWAPPALAPKSPYTRLWAQTSLSLSPFWWLGLWGSGSWGELKGGQDVPAEVYLDPQNTEEFNIRVDHFPRQELYSRSIRAAHAEMRLPLPFVPADADLGVILAGKSRVGFFWDMGDLVLKNGDPLKISAWGVGLRLPVGGDTAGAGQVIFTHLGLDVIVRTEEGGRIQNRPHLLFAFYRVIS